MRQSDSGFTLIEVLIAFTVLAFISLAIFQAITQSYRLRDVLMTEGEFYNGIRLAMGIMERDVSLAFSSYPFLPIAAQNSNPLGSPNQTVPIVPNIDVAAQLGGDAQVVSKHWGAVMHLSGIRPARFQGDDRSLHFVSAGHLKIYRDAKESVFARMGYRFEKLNRDETYTLIRTTNTNAFDVRKEEDAHTKEYKLLSGIQEFKLQYFDREKNQLASSWDSEKPENKNRFPDLIELTVVVTGSDRLRFEGQFKFKPELPSRELSSSF